MSTGELRVTLPFGLSEDEAKLLLAIKLYEVEKVSLGQVAKLVDSHSECLWKCSAGITSRSLIILLVNYGKR